jgi:ligand-binding sensor domain-containing protein
LKKTLLFIFVLFNLNLFGQFSPSNFELSSNYVESFLKDSRGVMWIGTDEGLNLITPSDNFVFYSNISNKKGLLNSEVYSLKELRNGIIVSFSSEGLSYFNPKTFSFKRVKLDSKPIAIYFDSEYNNYWVSTEFSGISVLNKFLEPQFSLKYDPLNPTTLSSSSSVFDNKNNLIDFAEENIFIGTPNGFNVFDRSQKNPKEVCQAKVF